MWFKKSFICLVSVLLTGLLLNSCYTYKTIPRKKYNKAMTQAVLIHLNWEDAFQNDLYLSNFAMTDSTVTGRLEKYGYSYEVPKGKSKTVEIHLDNTVKRPFHTDQTWTLPISGISKVEAYDLNTTPTILLTVAILVAINLAFTKNKKSEPEPQDTTSSCPFIYSHNGSSYQFEGETYGGAIFPSWERDDFMKLDNLQAVNNEYQIKMTNEAREIQNTNLAEIIVVDHPKETEVLIDKNGNCHSIQAPQAPVTAYSAIQRDILPIITAKDDWKYLSEDIAGTKQNKDAIYLSFSRPPAAGNANLVIRARNSIWLEYVIGQFLDLFGDGYAGWYNKLRTNPPKRLSNWMPEQNIPLSVFLMQNGVWKFVDYFHVTGPMADRDMVMPIDLTGIDTETVELKMETGFLFWETDYIGLDFSPEQPVQQQVVKLSSAVDQSGQEVTDFLNQDDKQYYVMPDIGNSAILKYNVPTPNPDMDRIVFLHSKGHYEILRNPEGKAQFRYLSSFRKPGRFSRFSKENFMEVKKLLAP